MTQHQVVIDTDDNQTVPAVSPQSLHVKRGDEIVFSSRHYGNNPPFSIRIAFPDGIVCNSPEGTNPVQELSMSGNASVSAMLCKNAGGSTSYTVAVSWDNASGGSRTAPAMTVATPDLVVDD